MKSNNRKRREFTANPDNPSQRAREQRQLDFLHFRAQGESINDACALVGVTRFAYEQSSKREKRVHASIATAPRPQPRKPDNPDNPDKPYPRSPRRTSCRISRIHESKHPRGHYEIFQKSRQNGSWPSECQPAHARGLNGPKPDIPREQSRR